MKVGVLFRPGSLWIGGHYSPKNRRWCINLVPCVTLWVAREGGVAPAAGMDICRSDRAALAQERLDLDKARTALDKSTRVLERATHLFYALENLDTPASPDIVAHLQFRQKLHDALDKPVWIFKEEVDAALLPTPDETFKRKINEAVSAGMALYAEQEKIQPGESTLDLDNPEMTNWLKRLTTESPENLAKAVQALHQHSAPRPERQNPRAGH